MLFIDSIKGYFTPNEDSIYNALLNSFHEKPSILFHSALDKFVKILQSQATMVQSDIARTQLENSLNAFINISKHQQYEKNVITLEQLVGIYLGF